MRDHEPSWMEKTFGSSWETSLAGYGLGGVGTICLLLGFMLDSKEVASLGIGAMGTAIVMIGRSSRSQGQHERDQPIVREKIAADIRNEVVPEAREEAKRAAVAELREHDRRDQR